MKKDTGQQRSQKRADLSFLGQLACLLFLGLEYFFADGLVCKIMKIWRCVKCRVGSLLRL